MATKSTHTSQHPPAAPSAHSTSRGAGVPAVTTLVVAAAVAVVTLIVAAITTGITEEQPLADPGVLTRWALPTAVMLRDIAGVLTIGGAVLAATTLPIPGAHLHHVTKALPTGAIATISKLVTYAASAWVLATTAHLIFAFSDVSGTAITAPGFGNQLAYAATNIPFFQYLTATLIFVIAASVAAAGAATPAAMAWTAGLGSAAWFCVSLTGHAAGAGNHEIAVSAWWIHSLGASLWVGGLVVVAALGRSIVAAKGKDAALVLLATRFSGLAGVAAVLVVISGIASAMLRLGTFADLLTTYGLVVVAKVLGTGVLLAAGWAHRAKLLDELRVRGGGVLFTKVIALEAAIFGAIMALAAVLSRTAPPIPDTEVLGEALTPAEIVTGEPLPPTPTLEAYLTQWQPDFLWIVGLTVLLERYLRGVVLLRRRGDSWPLWRTLSWVTGILTLFYILNGAPAVYGRVLFSAHMVQHMLLAMTIPLLLVFGSPMTLLLRASAARTDGTMGWRELILAIVHSRWVQFLSNPIVAAINFTGSIIVFYNSPAFPAAISTHTGHILMTVHFLLAGYIFMEVLVGDDPGMKRPAHPVRILILFATMAFHSFFAVPLMSSDNVLASTYFSALGWGIDLVDDQQYGGAVAWGIGEIPTLVLALAVMVDWSRSDSKEAKRKDRRADRDGDAELAAYNEMLKERSTHN